jgi:hypothetical protein
VSGWATRPCYGDVTSADGCYAPRWPSVSMTGRRQSDLVSGRRERTRPPTYSLRRPCGTGARSGGSRSAARRRTAGARPAVAPRRSGLAIRDGRDCRHTEGADEVWRLHRTIPTSEPRRRLTACWSASAEARMSGVHPAGIDRAGLKLTDSGMHTRVGGLPASQPRSGRSGRGQPIPGRSCQHSIVGDLAPISEL